MILAAGLLVLLGLGLFVGGVLTGATALYWGCVAACVVAAVLLAMARRRLFAAEAARTAGAPGDEAARTTGAGAPVAGKAAGGSAVPAAAGTGGTAAAGTATGTGSASAGGAAGTGEPGGDPVVGAARRTAAVPDTAPAEELPDPPVEDVEVTDLLIVVDLKDEVLVIDEHPRYHLEGCRHVAGRTTIPLPIDEARADGFTPCAVCEPDRNLAARARSRKASGNA